MFDFLNNKKKSAKKYFMKILLVDGTAFASENICCVEIMEYLGNNNKFFIVNDDKNYKKTVINKRHILLIDFRELKG